MQNALLWLALAGGLLAAFGAPSGALQATGVSPTQQTTATALTQSTKTKLPPTLEAIARMAEANVGTRVILSFITNSQVAYNPTAGEILALKQRGVANEVVVALLERGAQMRVRIERSARALLSESKSPKQRSNENSHPLPPNSSVQSPLSTPALVYLPYPLPIYPLYGQVTSFNNSYRTYYNGQPVYSGYYIRGY